MQKAVTSRGPEIQEIIGNGTSEMLDLSGKSIAMFCDFDGTISISDVTDILLERLANPDWHIIEKRWQAGELDDYACMAEQVALIRANWQDIVRILENIELDKSFKSFIRLCNQAAIPVYIGSSGLDKVINYFFTREGIQVNGIWAYQLTQSDRGWLLKFPEDQPRINCQFPKSVACKCALLEPHHSDNTYRIVIGDGRSDFCWAQKADFVFAKPNLANYCRDKQIDHVGFTNFADINEHLVLNILK